MRDSVSVCRFHIKPAVYLLLPALLLLLPMKWFCAAVFSAMLHECFHIGMLLLLRRRIYGIDVDVGGMEIQTEPMAPWQELLCALAGPASCLPLLVLARQFPRLAVCSAFHALYNLLPVYPMDGGRALNSLARMLLPPPLADRLYRFVETVVLLCIAGAGVYGSVILRLGLMPVLLAALIIGKARKKSLQR